MVIAINNAWSICHPEHLDWWAHSADFDKVGTLMPPKEVEALWFYRRNPRARYFKWREHYKRSRCGTMLLGVMLGCLNIAVSNGFTTDVCIAGSDFDYSAKEDRTHFYGRGKTNKKTRRMIKRNAKELTGKCADPLRRGKEWLLGQLEHVGRCYEENDCRLWNVGDHEPSLLPYPRP